MKNLDLNNPDHKKAIQEVLRQGASSEFWRIICQRLQIHIDSLQSALDSDALMQLSGDQYKSQVETMRNQKKDRQGIIDMPEVLTRELDDPEFFARKDDDEVYLDRTDFER